MHVLRCRWPSWSRLRPSPALRGGPASVSCPFREGETQGRGATCPRKDPQLVGGQRGSGPGIQTSRYKRRTLACTPSSAQLPWHLEAPAERAVRSTGVSARCPRVLSLTPAAGRRFAPRSHPAPGPPPSTKGLSEREDTGDPLGAHPASRGAWRRSHGLRLRAWGGVWRTTQKRQHLRDTPPLTAAHPPGGPGGRPETAHYSAKQPLALTPADGQVGC